MKKNTFFFLGLVVGSGLKVKCLHHQHNNIDERAMNGVDHEYDDEAYIVGDFSSDDACLLKTARYYPFAAYTSGGNVSCDVFTDKMIDSTRGIMCLRGEFDCNETFQTLKILRVQFHIVVSGALNLKNQRSI